MLVAGIPAMVGSKLATFSEIHLFVLCFEGSVKRNIGGLPAWGVVIGQISCACQQWIQQMAKCQLILVSCEWHRILICELVVCKKLYRIYYFTKCVFWRWIYSVLGYANYELGKMAWKKLTCSMTMPIDIVTKSWLPRIAAYLQLFKYRFNYINWEFNYVN